MPSLGPTGRRELIRRLRQLGFEGPVSGGRHQYMIRSDLKLTIPNPHRGDVSRDELEEVLEGWIKLGSVDFHCHSERSEESKDLALPATILDSSLRSAPFRISIAL